MQADALIPIQKMFATHPDVETCHGTSLQCLFVAFFFQIGITGCVYMAIWFHHNSFLVKWASSPSGADKMSTPQDLYLCNFLASF
ncbi:hypothetical protein [Chlorogloeopsis fritschii]|uniref:hypothetical protein n=1 Tax=Chlorogloeopsis fritschii TaxID=1124 RepID=UPI000585116E|nr:hypothetical protein [Chlorogloeopsis fritschii]